MKVNYEKYYFTKKQWIRYLLEGIVLALAINYLCYRSLWILILEIPIPIIYILLKKRQLIERRRTDLNYAFRDGLSALSVALKAGYSMENSVTECVRDLKKLYRSEDPILQEFIFIQNQIRVSVPVEILLRDFGKRSGVEDIRNFASVYGIAKRSGGNLGKILQSTAKTLADKIDVQKEVEACVAAKRMEQKIMTLVPCGIILYMQLISPDFLDSLYGNITGACVMTGCLAGYFAAFWMGRSIVRIEV